MKMRSRERVSEKKRAINASLKSDERAAEQRTRFVELRSVFTRAGLGAVRALLLLLPITPLISGAVKKCARACAFEKVRLVIYWQC